MSVTLTTGAGTRHVLAEAPNKANSQPTPQAGTKRKADKDEKDVDLDSVSVDGLKMDSCNQVRAKIRRLIDSGAMKKGEFASAIGVGTRSLNCFLAHTKPMDGMGSDTYVKAWDYFKKRQIAGVKLPAAKKQKATKSTNSDGSQSTAPKDISSITLPKEETDEVEVYDSCDEIRKKINAHLVKDGVTAAAFCRDLEKQVHKDERKVQSKQLTSFRGKKGPTSGNTSIIYYTAYIFFEKIRLAEGKEKNAHRLGMEKAWSNGADTKNANKHFFCHASERPFEDEFGSVTFQPFGRQR